MVAPSEPLPFLMPLPKLVLRRQMLAMQNVQDYLSISLHLVTSGMRDVSSKATRACSVRFRVSKIASNMPLFSIFQPCIQPAARCQIWIFACFFGNLKGIGKRKPMSVDAVTLNRQMFGIAWRPQSEDDVLLFHTETDEWLSDQVETVSSLLFRKQSRPEDTSNKLQHRSFTM